MFDDHQPATEATSVFMLPCCFLRLPLEPVLTVLNARNTPSDFNLEDGSITDSVMRDSYPFSLGFAAQFTLLGESWLGCRTAEDAELGRSRWPQRHQPAQVYTANFARGEPQPVRRRLKISSSVDSHLKFVLRSNADPNCFCHATPRFLILMNLCNTVTQS